MAIKKTFVGSGAENDCRATAPIDGAWFVGKPPNLGIRMRRDLVIDKHIAESYGQACGPDCGGDCFALDLDRRYPGWFTNEPCPDLPSCPQKEPDGEPSTAESTTTPDEETSIGTAEGE